MNTKEIINVGISKWWRTPTVTLSYIVWATISSTTAQAQVIDRYFTIQPIQVCNNAGVNCAPTPLFEAEVEKIYRQAGIAPLFLPTTQLDNTALLQTPGIATLDQPGNGQHPNPTTINAWFVEELETDPGFVLYGQAWLNANGVAINGTAVENFNGGNGRRDTLAHEIGHNFGLEHNNFGAGGANNLMTRGADRTVPDGLANIFPEGADLSQLTPEQITQIRSSPLLNQASQVIVDTNGSTPIDSDDFFLVEFQDGPAGVFLESLTLDLAPTNTFFDTIDNAPFSVFPGGDGSPFMVSNLNGINSAEIMLMGGNDSLDGTQELTLNFTPNSFTVGDSFRFGVDIDLFSSIDQFGATPEDLIGSLFSFTFSDGFGSQAEIENDLIANSIVPMNILTFNGQPMGGPQIPPGTITDPDPEPEQVSEPKNTIAILLIGLGGLYLHMKRRYSRA
ncbi:reprolysin-like metallopeptidase [Okeania hirsuta]|nr:zinc-dependent metalloprotease family protein [Okeania hirsuta]